MKSTNTRTSVCWFV